MRIVNFWTAASPFSRAMTQVSTCWARGQESQSIILYREKRSLWGVINVQKCDNIAVTQNIMDVEKNCTTPDADNTYWICIFMYNMCMIICTHNKKFKDIHLGWLDVRGYLQSALVMLASLTLWSVVRLLISTLIIWTGMCWTKLARAMDGSKEGSAKKMIRVEMVVNFTTPPFLFVSVNLYKCLNQVQQQHFRSTAHLKNSL